ncbi:MAG: filamentous hemagglutinin N-terminal domain-containing protein [Coleofasciculus sp. G1-WW12-02]|uniref:two-partner secretion domain-containing protein n=1 Tax=Coleofasciculus sp. G1-WW12-02 TaxID=3068483 RepID=UPI0032F13085
MPYWVEAEMPQLLHSPVLSLHTATNESINLFMALMSLTTMSMRFCLVSGLVVKLGVYILLNPVSAQIIPDATLGSEGSRFIEGVEIDRIEGGAARGVNLFHSFSEFNVLDGQQVYFGNPGGIENILSRVTGGNGSNILGTLGVLGNANLFLVNPNGIVFGPNARLDVAGSFVASTGNGFNFSDGSSFSATNPEAPPLLTINVTPGLQYGASQPQAEIVNQGNLGVGQDLTLVGNRLRLSGQLEAGRDLTLLATDTVEIRDSVSNPFIAEAGDELVVQGNQAVDIFALNHPDSGLFSGGDMVLRSANPVGGDAHYWSGGSFRIEQLDSSLGSFSSPNDPVIRASGDVSFESYTVASLHIFAGGSVTVEGNIRITGADAENGIVETVTLSDGTTVVEIDGKTKPTLDIRAGTTAFGTPGNPDNVNVNNPPGINGTGTSADITIGGNVTNNGGTVFLTNQYQPNYALTGGNIKVSTIDTSSSGEDGGSITINARRNIEGGNLEAGQDLTLAGRDLNLSGELRAGRDLTLLATGTVRGNAHYWSGGSFWIKQPDNLPSCISGCTIFQGGSLHIFAGGSVTIVGNVKITDADATNGIQETVTLSDGTTVEINSKKEPTLDIRAGTTVSGIPGNPDNVNTNNPPDIDGTGTSADIKITGNVINDNGNGGTVFLTNQYQPNPALAAGNITVGDINVFRGGFSSGENGGSITIDARGNIATASLYSSTSGEGNGGGITLIAGGNISTQKLYSPSNYLSIDLASNNWSGGNGGAISLTAGGNISTRQLDAFSLGGDGGAISLKANGNINTNGNDIYTSSLNGGDKGGGTISLEANGNITTGSLYSFSSRATGNDSVAGGAIDIFTTNGNISIGSMNSYSYSESGDSGTGGAVDISTNNGNIDIGNVNSYSYSESGDSGTGGAISLSAREGNILGEGSPVLNSFSVSDRGTAGDGGKVTLEARNNVSNLEILTLSSSANAKAGDVAIGGFGDLSLTDIKIVTSGQLTVKLPTGQDTSKNPTFKEVSLNVGEAGQSGDVTVTSSGDLTFNNSRILSDTKGNDRAGDVTITSSGLVTFNDSQIISNTSSEGQAGKIEITATEGRVLMDNSTISSIVNSDNAKDAAGTITVEAGTIEMRNDAVVKADSNSTESAPGNITLLAVGRSNNPETPEVLIHQNSRVTSDSQNNVGGYGTIQIEATQGSVALNQATVSAKNEGSDFAADIFINARENISIANKSKISADGNFGRIFVGSSSSEDYDNDTGIRPQAIAIDNSQLTTTNNVNDVTKSEDAGEINLRATGNTSITNSTLLGTTVGSGEGGSINIETGSLSLTSSLLDATTSGTGKAGDVSITADNEISLRGGQISSAVEQNAEGDAGSITIKTRQLTLNDAQATVSSTGDGTAGNLTVDAPSVLLSNQAKLTATTEEGSGGNIQLQNLSSLQLGDRSEISASTESGTGGNISVEASGGTVALSGNSRLAAEATKSGNAGGVTINTQQLSIEQEAQVAASSKNGSGTAGNVDITASGVTLNSGGQITAETDSGTSTPEQGNIFLRELNTLQVNNSRISSSTNTGKAGNVEITADEVTLDGTFNFEGTEQGGVLAQATGDEGNAGSVTLNTSRLSLDNGAEISASNVSGNERGDVTLQGLTNLSLSNGSEISASTQTGQAGSVTVKATESVTVNDNSLISSSSTSGEAGSVSINAPELVTLNNSLISSSTESGQAGSVSIHANDTVALSGTFTNSNGTNSPAGVLAQATQGGNAGGVRINTQQLSIEQGAQVAASSKNGSGTAGDVDITASTVTLNNGEITAETDAGGTGNPANITLRNLNSLNLSNNSSISASTQTGQAGSVNLNQGENPATSVTLNNSSISAQATGDEGNAGDVTINAETLFLNNGEITAKTRGNGQGANITLNLTDWLRLDNESLISAEAFDDANGGNVKINLTANHGILFALPSNSNGSDIIAKAAGGNGGNITITAPLGIYGIEERKAIDGNRTNDIDASSEFGAPGQITINSLVIDPSQGLIELPTDTAAPQLDQTCSPSQSGKNEFTVTGRDGLPPSPTDILTPEQPLADLGTPVNSTATQPTPTPTPPASPKPIVEAQGWIIDEQGNITLVANVPTANSQGVWQPHPSCQGGR